MQSKPTSERSVGDGSLSASAHTKLRLSIPASINLHAATGATSSRVSTPEIAGSRKPHFGLEAFSAAHSRRMAPARSPPKPKQGS